MTLTEQEYNEYLKAHLGLLFFAGLTTGILPENTAYEKFLYADMQLKFQCRNAFIEDQSLLDEYLELNAAYRTAGEIDILNGFRKIIPGRFIIYNCLKDHAVFMDAKGEKQYAVKALGDRFDELIHDFPAVVSTAILPFKDKIIYDGFMSLEAVVGPNITRNLKEDYKNAREQNKIIHTLD